MPYTLDRKGKLLIVRREGIVLVPYQDGEHKSIGIGSNDPTLKAGDEITVKQAFERFANDIAKRETLLKGLFSREPTQDQFNALFSCFYQSGYRNVPWIIILHNYEAPAEVIEQFFAIKQFCRRKSGAYMPGLEKRRKIEGAIYARGAYEDDLDVVPLYDKGDPTKTDSVPYTVTEADLPT